MQTHFSMLGIDLDAIKGAVVVWNGAMPVSPFGNHTKGELISAYECRYPQYEGETNLQRDFNCTARAARAQRARIAQRVIWRASGKCSRCGAEKDEYHATCPACRKHQREYKRIINGCQARI